MLCYCYVMKLFHEVIDGKICNSYPFVAAECHMRRDHVLEVQVPQLQKAFAAGVHQLGVLGEGAARVGGFDGEEVGGQRPLEGTQLLALLFARADLNI